MDFYEKALKENYDPLSIGVIVSRLCFENMEFSHNFAVYLLQIINKVSYDESKPFLDLLSYFIGIKDSIQKKRIEWILGIPQQSLNKFETFALVDSLEDNVIQYETPLFIDSSNHTSLLNLIYQNKKRWENSCMVLLCKLIDIANNNSAVFDYLISLPPPCYIYSRFSDWFKSFIVYYLEDAQKYYSSYSLINREELGNTTLSNYKIFEDKLNSKLSSNQGIIKGLVDKKINNFEEKNEESINSNFQENHLVIGKFVYDKVFDEKILEESSYDSNDKVIIKCLDSCVYYTKSKPVKNEGKNLAFPQQFINENGFIV